MGGLSDDCGIVVGQGGQQAWQIPSCCGDVLLGDFAGTCRLAVAIDILDLLEVLCGKSLLRSWWPESAQGEIRFDMYESIAAYAFEHLSEDGEDTATHQRHATHFIEDGEERIEDFASPEGTDLAWFDLNRDNLVAVVQRQARVELQFAQACIHKHLHSELRGHVSIGGEGLRVPG